MTSGSTKIKLVYGAEPRVGNKTLAGETVHVFDGGVMAYTGVMITISLDVGLELTWDSGMSLCLYLYLSDFLVCLRVLVLVFMFALTFLCACVCVGV